MLGSMITLLALTTLTPLQREALDAARLRYSANTHQVLSIIYLAPRPITPVEVRQLTSLDASLVGSILHRLEKGQMIERSGRGLYRMHTSLRHTLPRTFTLESEEPKDWEPSL